SGRNLADADFTGAYLEETNLAGARLDAASFFGASLKRANLAGASLRRADMREGKIASQGASGDLKILQHDTGPTDLPAALMSSANLERAKLCGVIAIQ